MESCSDREVFDVDALECVEPAQADYCFQTDSRGSEWEAQAGQTAVKECSEDLGEGATGKYYCMLFLGQNW